MEWTEERCPISEGRGWKKEQGPWSLVTLKVRQDNAVGSQGLKTVLRDVLLCPWTVPAGLWPRSGRSLHWAELPLFLEAGHMLAGFSPAGPFSTCRALEIYHCALTLNAFVTWGPGYQ